MTMKNCNVTTLTNHKSKHILLHGQQHNLVHRSSTIVANVNGLQYQPQVEPIYIKVNQISTDWTQTYVVIFKAEEHTNSL